ncbi:MAG: ParB/RepB/Spo0J family partition protein [Ectothiorhodospiraceae bacterium]|nr:ParB/RepB/Spo0J family partition protein [Ectothiorhodospiraceae bacterium]
MAKRKGLGRGLEALLAGSAPGSDAGRKAPAASPEDGELRALPVERIRRGRYQPRVAFDTEALDELAQSIRARGVVQPIVVRPLPDGGFEIVAGERRWRAAQRAGLAEIPAVVRDIPDEAALAVALVENVQRENLNPVEEARALKRLHDEFGLTHQQAAEAVGRSRAAVSNLIRLLDLAPEVLEQLEGGALEMGHGRALLTLAPAMQREAAAAVTARGLSVRQTEALVRQMTRPPGQTPSRGRTETDPDVRRLETDLSERLGAAVRIRGGRTGRGSIEIRYGSLEELDGILERLR